MTHVDTGTYAAKRQSFRAPNPRDLLRRLIEKRPSADRDDLFAAFSHAVMADDDLLEAVFTYWFDNNYRSLTEPRSHQARRAVERERAVAALKTQITARAARMVLLDLVLPNGKTLRDCTGKDCAVLGPKVGAWLKRIAAKVKPAEIVGNVLSETEVRKLYAK